MNDSLSQKDEVSIKLTVPVAPDATVPLNRQVHESWFLLLDSIARRLELRRGLGDSFDSRDRVVVELQIYHNKVLVASFLTLLDEIETKYETPLIKVEVESEFEIRDEIGWIKEDPLLEVEIFAFLSLQDELTESKKKWIEIDDFEYHRRYQNDVISESEEARQERRRIRLSRLHR